MNRFIALFLLLCGLAFAKSNLNLSIQNPKEYRSKEELLKPLKGDTTFGNKASKVVLTVFDSYSCIHCGKFYKEIFPILEKNYIKTGKVLFVHKEFPLDRWALFATKTVACSTNKENQMEDIYTNQEKLFQEKDYENALLNLGSVNKKCVESFKNEIITDQIFEYTKVLNIKSTPTVFLNGKKIERMTQSRLLRQIEEAINN